MNIRGYTLLIFMLLICVVSHSFGQLRNTAELPLTLYVPEIALVNFHSANKTISEELAANGAREVEQVLTPATRYTWINYSSIVREGASNHISANISGANLPPDVVVKIRVSADAGEGVGEVGAPVEEVALSNLPQKIITNIGSCYTGKGMNKGHQLIFSWENANGEPVSEILDPTISISVTYTIASTQ